MSQSARPLVAFGPLLLLLSATVGGAAPPGEVGNVRVGAGSNLQWNSTAGATDYNVYRGRLGALAGSNGFDCIGDEIAGTTFAVPDNPAAGSGFAYLVSAESADGEGAVGVASSGGARTLLGRCDQVMAWHILNRVGYGWSEWARDRLKTLGAAGFINEQLNPASISEANNTPLNDGLALTNPTEDFYDLVNRHTLRAIHGRRQLEEQLVIFLQNHFNTDINKVAGFYFDPANFETNPLAQLLRDYEELDTTFRQQAFAATFRDILDASSLSRPMIYYLDTQLNVVGRPNENFSRELLELHSMGTDGGFTEEDVRNLARVFTGWKICKKKPSEKNDPTKACITLPVFTNYSWGVSMIPTQHDAGAKVLFAGTPYQKNIPARAGVAGINDVEDAFDAIAAHPSTARFISTKLAQKFLSDTPSPAMIQAGIDAYNQSGGRFIEVVRALLAPAQLLDPRLVGGKVKWPDEFFFAAGRGLRAETNATTLRLHTDAMYDLGQDYLIHAPPNGISERGSAWLDSSHILARQNYGLDLAMKIPDYATHITEMVTEYGLNTPEKIVDFFADALIGGRLSSTERQRLITYLNTDDLGQPSAYDDARIREMLGTMLGLPHALEQ